MAESELERRKCGECDGKGEWLGFRTYHTCNICEGTGWITDLAYEMSIDWLFHPDNNKLDEDEEKEEEDVDTNDSKSTDTGTRIDAGYVYAVCAGEDIESAVQLQFPFVIIEDAGTEDVFQDSTT